MCRPEEGIDVLSKARSHSLKAQPLTEPGAHCFDETGWPVSPWNLPVLGCAAVVSFYVDNGNPNSDPNH